MLKEFKEFIARGNVLDLAVGVVMGTAFKAVVDSFVADVIMPLIGLLIGNINLADMKLILKPAVVEAGEVIRPELVLAYGHLIQVIINFLLIAFFIFLMVKIFNKFRRKQQENKEISVKSDDIILLEEIRDLLAKK